MHLLLSALGQHCHRVQRIQRTDCIVICWGASGSLCSKKTYGASLTPQPAALKFLIVLMVSPRCRDGKTNELARARDCSLIYTHLQMPCLLIAALWNSPLFCNDSTFFVGVCYLCCSSTAACFACSVGASAVAGNYLCSVQTYSTVILTRQTLLFQKIYLYGTAILTTVKHVRGLQCTMATAEQLLLLLLLHSMECACSCICMFVVQWQVFCQGFH